MDEDPASPDPLPADGPSPGSAARLGPSLRLRVVLVLLAINLVVFTAGGFWLQRSFDGARVAQISQTFNDLIFGVRRSIERGGELNAQRILEDPIWAGVGDAMIVDTSLERVAGRVVHRGVALNPRGVGEGHADRGELLEVLAEVLETGRDLDGLGGRARVIEDSRGLWGAMWVRMPDELLAGGQSPWQLLPWFLVSTVLLTGGSYLVLSGLVLQPVRRLASGVSAIEAGDLSARVATGSGSDELTRLVRGFNAMAAEVQGFSRRLEDEVRRATRQAREAENAALTQRRLAAMGEFTAGIAHEINNPLGGLLNATEVLGRDDLDEAKRRRYLDLLADGLERIQTTVGQLLRFTPRQTAAGAVDLVDVARDALALVRHRATGIGVELGLELDGRALPVVGGEPDGACPAWGARNELGQAVLNLLGNALDALEEAGTGGRMAVRLETRGEGGPACTVVDDGPGMTDEVRERARDLFFTTKEVGKGSGLGLAIVDRIAAAHGGRLVLAAADGGGLAARIELPRPPADGAAAPDGGTA